MLYYNIHALFVFYNFYLYLLSKITELVWSCNDLNLFILCFFDDKLVGNSNLKINFFRIVQVVFGAAVVKKFIFWNKTFFFAQKWIKRLVEKWRNCNQIFNIRNAVSTFPLCNSLPAHIDFFCELLLRDVFFFSQSFQFFCKSHALPLYDFICLKDIQIIRRIILF